MARPTRNSSPTEIPRHRRTFFATTKIAMGRRLLQSERNATLIIDVLRSLAAERRIQIDDFVIMPDHVHLLMTLDGEMPIEKAMTHQGQVLLPPQEGVRISRRSLAGRVL